MNILMFLHKILICPSFAFFKYLTSYCFSNSARLTCFFPVRIVSQHYLWIRNVALSSGGSCGSVKVTRYQPDEGLDPSDEYLLWDSLPSSTIFLENGFTLI